MMTNTCRAGLLDGRAGLSVGVMAGLAMLIVPGALGGPAGRAGMPVVVSDGAEVGGKGKPVASIYDLTVTTIDGVDAPLSKYRGEVVLIVNTASR